jgi:hypothetical protein
MCFEDSAPNGSVLTERTETSLVSMRRAWWQRVGLFWWDE